MWLEWEALATFNFCDQFRCMGSRCTIAHEEAFSLFFSFFFFTFTSCFFSMIFKYLMGPTENIFNYGKPL